MTGAGLIAVERIRQREEEGFVPDHDDEHINDELVMAAVCYASPVQLYVMRKGSVSMHFGDPWPNSWAATWDKRPTNENGSLKLPTPKQRIRMLVKAGALIAAEIDRLQRLGEKK